MTESIAYYLAQLNDAYAPVSPNPSLQQWDNYQIYTLVCLDNPYTNEYLTYRTRVNTDRTRADLLGAINFYDAGWGYYWNFSDSDTRVSTSDGQLVDFLAYQQYNLSVIPFDLYDIIQALPTVESLRPEYQSLLVTTSILSTNTLVTSDINIPTLSVMIDVGFFTDKTFCQTANDTSGNNQFTFVELSVKNEVIDSIRYYTIKSTVYRDTYQRNEPNNPIPTYLSLVGGYVGDTRINLKLPLIIPTKSGKLIIEYYRNNPYEPIPSLTTIDFIRYQLNIVAGNSIVLPLDDVVFGTLLLTGEPLLVNDIKTKLNNILIPNSYRWNDYSHGNANAIMSQWVAMYQSKAMPSKSVITRAIRNSSDGFSLGQFMDIQYLIGYSYKDFGAVTLRILAANNNYWSNDDKQRDDINDTIDHSMFAIDNERAYKWYIKPVTEGNGDLTMDSPRLIEIHKALEAEKYSKNFINADNPRITNLGFLVENLARINGLRFDNNGDLDLVKEKNLYQPRTIENPTLGSPDSNGKYNNYGMSCWGKIGMIVPHLPTTYGVNKRELKLFDIVHDTQQLQVAILRQLDVALSIQHGSEIRVTGLDGKIHAYPNQLAVNLECLQRLEKIKYTTDRNLLISTVAGTEVRELFSGIGIPVTQKFLQLKAPLNPNKGLSLPYFGHQKNKPSTAQMLTTVHVNLAVINGVLMPKKQPESNSLLNPFTHFTAKK